MEPIRPEEAERLGTLTLGDFDGRVGEAFRLGDEGDLPLDLVLIEVRDLAHETDPPGTRRPFSLLFEGSADRALAQSIHPLRHPKLGRLPLFLVPVGQEEDLMHYEAIFR